MPKRAVGLFVLLVLAALSVALELRAYANGTESVQLLLFYIIVAAFGLYALGGVFFDYPVTFLTTVRPTDHMGLRMLRAAAGLVMWASTIWVVAKG